MDTEPLDSEVKARVSQQQKEQLRGIAVSRHLKLADIIREAVREKIAAEAIKAEEAVPA